MENISDTIREFKCPSPICNNKLKMKYSDAINRGKIQCPKCKSEIVFIAASRNMLKSAIYDYEKAEKKIEESVNQLLAKAHVIYKKSVLNSHYIYDSN